MLHNILVLEASLSLRRSQSNVSQSCILKLWETYELHIQYMYVFALLYSILINLINAGGGIVSVGKRHGEGKGTVGESEQDLLTL